MNDRNTILWRMHRGVVVSREGVAMHRRITADCAASILHSSLIEWHEMFSNHNQKLPNDLLLSRLPVVPQLLLNMLRKCICHALMHRGK